MASKQSTLDHWEKFWQEKTHIDEVYSNDDRIYLNLKKVTGLKGKKILEVGAGSGRDSFQLARDDATVFVLDYSPGALKIVKNLKDQLGTTVYLIQGDAFQVPVPDETFDVVFHQGLLEHFKDPLLLLKENHRILKRGGFLLVDVPQRYHVYTIIKHILIFFNKWFAGWETEFSIGQLKKLMHRSGFEVLHEYGSWMQPGLFYRIVREVLKKVNIKLPLYPPGFAWTRKLRSRIRQKLINKRWAFYTFLDIGVVARKK